jgi:hypothetical protein
MTLRPVAIRASAVSALHECYHLVDLQAHIVVDL